MIREQVVLKLSYVFLKTISVILGSLSIAFLWISFYDGRAGNFAFGFMLVAVVIALGLPRMEASPRRR
jgi:hypothetical protein